MERMLRRKEISCGAFSFWVDAEMIWGHDEKLERKKEDEEGE